MNISFIEPRVELKPYVRAIWIFESEVGLPASEVSIVAPNGCAKLIVSCENSLVSTVEGRSHLSREQSLYFVGLRDIPVTLSTPPGRAGFIGVEFYPFGAFPVLRLSIFASKEFTDGWGGHRIEYA